MRVAALFISKDSIYKTLPGVDCYDADRDALTFDGGCPVVAHPPCRLWGTLKHFCTAPITEKELAIWSIEQVRNCGGVLEHPAFSSLWCGARLPLPDGFPDKYGGYTLQIDQFHWGHQARKRTWLYIVGCKRVELPLLPRREGEPTHTVTTSKRRIGPRLPEMKNRERSSTPIDFAKWLVKVARKTSRYRASKRP